MRRYTIQIKVIMTNMALIMLNFQVFEWFSVIIGDGQSVHSQDVRFESGIERSLHVSETTTTTQPQLLQLNKIESDFVSPHLSPPLPSKIP
jgi:hypothetical protein